MDIEYEDGFVQKSEHRYEQMYIEERRGIVRHVHAATGHTDHLEPNGQGVMRLTAWKGCDVPEEFVSSELMEKLTD